MLSPRSKEIELKSQASISKTPTLSDLHIPPVVTQGEEKEVETAGTSMDQRLKH
jgi:hypothetical protein